MDCGSLFDVYRTVKKIPEFIIAKIAFQVLSALEYLHTQVKIVHRDIKPANILINSKANVKLADFGMAGILEADPNASIAVFNTFQGSESYMSVSIHSRFYEKTTKIFLQLFC